MRVSDVTTQFPDKVAIQALIDELKAYADSIATGDIDLSNYVTKSELQAKLDALDINIDLSSYATKEELTNAINSIDLSSYALKTEIPTVPSLDGYATTEYVDNAVSNIPTTDLTDYATKEYVSTAINSIPATDLSNYYTKAETYSKTEVDTLVANSGGSSSGGSSSGDNTNIYSTTEEVAIGTWIDGKTIYRKVFEVTISSKTNGTPVITSIEHGIENFYQLVDLRCINNSSTMKTSIGAYGLIPSNLTNLSSWNNIKNYSIRPTVTSDKIMIDAGIQWNKAVITVIIDYTKSA